MLRRRIYIKLTAALLFVLFAEFAMGSFSGSDDSSKNKFSLSNLGTLSKNYSLTTLQTFKFKLLGSQDFLMKQNINGVEVNSTMRLQDGNTTYVYPYKYVIKMPKFKTPAPPVH